MTVDPEESGEAIAGFATDSRTTPERFEYPAASSAHAFVGIDWADQKHAWALRGPTASEVEGGPLDHTPEAVEGWAAELARRFGGRSIAVALEQSRGALLFMLTKYAHLVLFPVHPTTLARRTGAKILAVPAEE